MKKTIISVVVATVLGIQSTTLKAGSSLSSRKEAELSLDSLEQRKKDEAVLRAFADYAEQELQKNLQKEVKNKLEPQKISNNTKRALVSSAQKQLEILQEQLNYHIAMYGSIIGPRQKDIVPRMNITIPYFHNPHLIYNKNKTHFSRNLATSNVPTAGDIIIEQNLSFFSISEARTFIEKRRQYAAIVDKAISLHVFEETENRLKKIGGILASMKHMNDLKWVAELQTYVEGTLAVIHNEATKLQMVAHLRNAEQELIRQQKYKRNIRILNRQNTQMPTVKVQYVKAVP